MKRQPEIGTIDLTCSCISIACKYGDVLPEDIAVKNTLVLGEPLNAGMKIIIP